MKKKSFVFTSILALILGLLGTEPVLAQAKELTCKSVKNRYTFCRADTDNKVKLERVENGYCRLNSSWGYDNRGIWVDRGCQAVFRYGKSNSGRNAAIGATVFGGVVLAAILASRGSHSDERKFRNSTEAYNFGYSTGRNDYSRGKGNNPNSHRNEYDSRWDRDFRSGYTAAYNGLANSNNSQNLNRTAYNAGFGRGQQDARAHRNSHFKRYRNEFNRNTRSDFKRGYETGYRKNSWNYDKGNSNSRVPNWLVGTWVAYGDRNQSYQITYYSSGSVRQINRQGNRVTSSMTGYYRNGILSFPSLGRSYRIDRRGRNFEAVDTSGRVRNSTYYRIS
jgi:hypothetical protein